MAKDVNIHVKTDGAPQATKDLDGIAQGATKVGENVEQMGHRSSRAMDWFANGLKSLAGPLGFAAVIAAVSSLAGKVSQFFSDFKNRCDEAVDSLQNVRRGFEGVFTAMGAFDEKSRKGITTDTINLLKKTSVSQEVGLPVISEYARQFHGLVKSGQLSPEQYQQGLEGMLGFAARRGGAATPELITLMAGLGMKTPEQQGTFRRQIGAVAGEAGLTTEEIVDVLGRATPTATAMGWKPDEMLKYIGILTAGAIGRQRITLPTATLEALIHPHLENVNQYRMSPLLLKNPTKLFDFVASKQQKMNPQAFGRMLTDIYGVEGGAGVYKLLNSTGSNMPSVIANAATPQAALDEMAIEQASQGTQEREQALTDAMKLEELTKSDPLFYKKQIRQIGAQERETLDLEHPYIQKLHEILNPAYAFGFIPGKIANLFKSEGSLNEDAAFVKWIVGLSDERKQEILNKTKKTFGGMTPEVLQLKNYYQNMPSQSQYQDLVGSTDVNNVISIPQSKAGTYPAQGTTINNIDYGPKIIYNPVAGTASDRGIGPRFDPNMR
ncbi:MAG: hypothetical protein ABSF37_03070 [Sedimentisphaerales bacterium]|jgi:hypothetical protein